MPNRKTGNCITILCLILSTTQSVGSRHLTRSEETRYSPCGTSCDTYTKKVWRRRLPFVIQQGYHVTRVMRQTKSRRVVVWHFNILPEFLKPNLTARAILRYWFFDPAEFLLSDYPDAYPIIYVVAPCAYRQGYCMMNCPSAFVAVKNTTTASKITSTLPVTTAKSKAKYKTCGTPKEQRLTKQSMKSIYP